MERRERPLGGERLKPSSRKQGIKLPDWEQMWADVLLGLPGNAAQLGTDSALLS